MSILINHEILLDKAGWRFFQVFRASCFQIQRRLISRGSPGVLWTEMKRQVYFQTEEVHLCAQHQDRLNVNLCV